MVARKKEKGQNPWIIVNTILIVLPEDLYACLIETMPRRAPILSHCVQTDLNQYLKYQ